MGQGNSILKVSAAGILSAGMLLGNAVFAQTKPATMPDAQIEANVLKALAGAPELADQSITSTTVYGVVTLNGTVRDEPSRDLAEHLVANTAGVQKVVDQMVISAPAAVSSDSQQGASNPNLQSDGTMAAPQGQSQNQAAPPPPPAPAGQYPPPPQGGQYPPQQTGQYPQYPQPYPQAGQYPPPYPTQPGQYPPQYPQYPPQYPRSIRAAPLMFHKREGMLWWCQLDRFCGCGSTKG